MRSDVLNSNSGSYLQSVVVNPNYSQLHSASDTMDAIADNGTTHVAVKADVVFTLPAVAVDIEYTFILGVDLDTTEYMRIAPNANDKFIGGCGTTAGTDNKYLGITGAKKGACLKLRYGSSVGWIIVYKDDASQWTAEA
tara:strand:+ start:1833 stop:2249 length:417 start_codon:yes stop_codon:yes gene_type:complete